MISVYSRINRFPIVYRDILKIDKPMRWIMADEKDQYVSIYKKNKDDKLIDIDVASCFPSICKYLFKEDNPEFVEKIYNLTDKKERNILIATTLKESGYLKVLNIISKMLILGYTFDRRDSDKNSLLEFEKDGNLIFCDKFYLDQIQNIIDSEFLEFIEKNQFIFHMDEYDYYIRCNKTSIFWSENGDLRIKGLFKHVPSGVKEIISSIFKGDNIDFNIIKEVYSELYFKVIRHNNLLDILNKYYMCEDGRVINYQSQYEKYNYYKTNIDPSIYLKTWIYPVLLFQKQAVGGII